VASASAARHLVISASSALGIIMVAARRGVARNRHRIA